MTSPGIMYEVCCDGHEKFGSLALTLGPVGIGVYGMREKAGGKVVHLVVVPNARSADAVGHIHLDSIEKMGGKLHLSVLQRKWCLYSWVVEMSVQLTVDKGSETGVMYANHMTLR